MPHGDPIALHRGSWLRTVTIAERTGWRLTGVVTYDDEVGWLRVDGVLDPDEATALASECAAFADGLHEPGIGDKPHGDTRRLSKLGERVPRTVEVAEAFSPFVDQILGTDWVISEIAYRCPSPGTGEQFLHADDVARVRHDEPYRCAVAIVALCEFSEVAGATRLIPGSHRRLDLQRQSQQLREHEDQVFLSGTPGTAFLFCGHVLHAGSLNRSDASRPALQISFRTQGLR